MTTEAQTGQATGLHGGRLVAKRLQAHGVTKLFTLSGGHLFSIYDGCREEGIDIVDVRHEQSAAFAAEGWAKATREVGVRAHGRAGGHERHERDGFGAAEQVAHAGAGRTSARVSLGSGLAAGDRSRAVRRARDEARAHGGHDGGDPRPGGRGPAGGRAPPSGPAFIDFPLDQVFMEAGWRTWTRLRRPIRWPLRQPLKRSSAPRLSRRAAAGGDGRHRPLLGAWGGGPAAALRRAVGAGLPQRPGARLRADRPSAVLLARAAPASRAPAWRW